MLSLICQEDVQIFPDLFNLGMVSTQVWGKRLQRNSSPVLLTSLRSSNWHAMTTQTSLAKRFRLCKASGMWWLSTTRESLSENGGSTTTRRRSSSTSCAVHRMCRRSWQSIAIFTSTLFQVPQGVQTFFPHGMEWIVACFFSLPASCILTTVPLKVSYLSTKVFSQNFTPGELLSGVFKQWAGDVCFPPFHHGTPSYTHQNSSYMTWS